MTLQLSNGVRLCSKKILKNDTNKLIYKTKIDSQTENRFLVTTWEGGEGRDKLGVRMNRYTLLYIK